MNANKVVFRFVSISFSMLVLLVIFIGIFKASAFCYEFGYRIFSEPPMTEVPGKEVVVQLEEAGGLNPGEVVELGETLEEKGLVRDSWLFTAQYYLSAYKDELLPGTYTLNTSMTAKEMMDVMSTPVEEVESEE